MMKHLLSMLALAALVLVSCTEIEPENKTDNTDKDSTVVKPASKSIVIGICPSGMGDGTRGYYKRCINDAGGVMMLCDNYCWTEEDAKAFVDKIDGLISPGSTANDADGTGLWPYKRSVSENYIIKAALAAGKPILGICYGHQRLNVVLGGTTSSVSTLAPKSNVEHKVVDSNGTNVGVSSLVHNIQIDTASRLYRLLGTEETMVNTSHNYAVSKLGTGLKVVARAEDGIVEAIEGDNLTGVQFHPEFLYGKLGIEKFRCLFDELVLEAQAVKNAGN